MDIFTIGELATATVQGKLSTGVATTIAIYDAQTGASITLTSAACVEVGTTGIFYFALSNITTQPTQFTQYIFQMTNGVDTTLPDSLRVGGYPDLIDPTGPNVVTITVEETDTTPIPDVFAKVYNQAQTVLLRTATTDTNGQFILNMEGGTYSVVLFKNAVNFSPTETLVVLGPTADTYNGEVLTIPVPATANVCRVAAFSFVQNSTGATPSFDGTATIISTPFNIDNIFYEGKVVSATFDAGTGLFYWDLPYNARVKLNSRDIGISNGTISVPPQAAASLNDLDIR